VTFDNLEIKRKRWKNSVRYISANVNVIELKISKDKS